MTITKISLFEPEIPEKRPAGWTPLLVLAAVVSTIGTALPVGYNIGVINTPAQIIRAFCNSSVAAHYDVELTDGQLSVLWSAVVSIFLIGGMTGSLSGGWAADRFGRKGGVVLTNAVSVLSAALLFACKYAHSVELLLLARLLVGLSGGLATSVVPMYLTELSPAHLRGALGVFCPLGVCLGVLVGQFMGLDWLLGTEQSWNVLLGLFGPLVAACSLVLPVLPESPKYLYLVRGDEARGVEELSRIRQQPEERLGEELRALRKAHKSDQQQQQQQQGGAGLAATSTSATWTWTARRVLSSPELRLPLVLVCAVQAGQQVSGINAVFYYSTSVFRSAGLSARAAQYASLGAGVVNFGVAVLALGLVNNFGRRVLILLSICSSIVCLVVLGASITYTDAFPWMPYVTIVALLMYVFFYGIGMGPIPYFIGSELFDVGPRPVGMAMGSLANWGGNFLVGMSFTTMQSLLGAASFYVFATLTALQGILLKFYFPETKGRDPGEVADMLKLGFKSKVATDVPAASSSNDGSQQDAERNENQECFRIHLH